MSLSLRKCFLPILFAVLVDPAICASAPSLQISAEIAPAGGWAQIKIYAAKPMAIQTGRLLLNLDATLFGTGAMVGLFGANGDATGIATITGPQIDVQFSSATGGIGQLAGLPVIVISVPVLASAANRSVVISATSPDSSVSIGSGSVTVWGTLSVQKIPAGMGVIPAGAVVPVFGTGFTASTTVTIDGVAIASTRFVSVGEMDVTIGGATELVGKRARVTDGGVEFDYFCFQPSDPVNFPENTYFGSAVTNVQPLFPLLAMTGFAGFTGYVGGVTEVQNPNPGTATVNLTKVHPPFLQSQATLSIPAGSWAIFDGMDSSDFVGTSDLPVRVVAMTFCGAGVALPVCLMPTVPYDEATLGPAAPVLTPSSLAFNWQVGSSTPPPPLMVLVSADSLPTASTASGAPWLLVSTPPNLPAGLSSMFSVAVDPSRLTVGTYHGSILVTEAFRPPATLPVSLTVTNSRVPLISVTPASLSFTAPGGNAAPYSQTLAVTSDSGPAAFSITLPSGIWGTWLKVSPMSGITPATLTVTWDPAVTSQIYYQERSAPGSILISGPGNAITVPATFNITGVQTFQTFLGASGTGPNGLVFSAQIGSSPQTQTINVDPIGTIAALADQAWLSVVSPTSGPSGNQTVLVTANPAGLTPGVYHATVTVAEAGLAPIAVPVTLGVWSSAPPLTITIGSFTFVQTVGEPAPPYRTAQVDSGGMPLPLTISLGASWLNVGSYTLTPTPIRVGVIQTPASPGEYDGSFTLQSPGGSIYVPVTLLVEPGPIAPSVLSQVVNAASGIVGGVSPGEIIALRGYGVGASALSGLKLDASGKVESNLNGLQVTFDGKPAPLIYTSANQTNLIVPYEVAGNISTVLQIVYQAAAGTVRTGAWVLPVVAAAPAIFTMDTTGVGSGAIVNQAGTVNSAANPAARGSVISIYATGEGQTSPLGVTGSVTQSNTKTPVLPVTVTIGGMDATVQYAGSAPGEVAGLMQVNVVVPQGVGPGATVQVTVSVGGIASQAGVTIAVR